MTSSWCKSNILPSAVIVKLEHVLYSICINTRVYLSPRARAHPQIIFHNNHTKARVVILTLLCLRRHVRKPPGFIKRVFRAAEGADQENRSRCWQHMISDWITRKAPVHDMDYSASSSEADRLMMIILIKYRLHRQHVPEYMNSIFDAYEKWYYTVVFFFMGIDFCW